MTGLDWFQARFLARSGTAVRRDAWRKWLTFESYVWLITQPVWEEQDYDRRVVQQWDFGADEFLAHDWTDAAFALVPAACADTLKSKSRKTYAARSNSFPNRSNRSR